MALFMSKLLKNNNKNNMLIKNTINYIKNCTKKIINNCKIWKIKNNSPKKNLMKD